MFRLASLGTFAAILLGAVAWACTGSEDATDESPMTAPESAESPSLPSGANETTAPPSSEGTPPPPAEPQDAGASDAEPKKDAGAPPKADGGKPPPPPPPPACPGRIESEPNDSPTGEYNELGPITCGTISATDVDHFYVDGKGGPVRYVFEAEKGAKLEVWTVLGPVETVKATVHANTIKTDRKIFFRVSEGAAVQTYRITLTRL